jgi:Calx-beta domain
MRSRHVHLTFIALLGLAATVLAVAPAASGAKPSGKIVRPVIGVPVTSPAKPAAGGRFAFSVKVRRSDNGAALLQGTATAAVTAGGKPVAHTTSFRGGMARVSFAVPAGAATVRIVLTIRVGRQSATKTFSFAVQAPASLSIADASVVEGNSGTTMLSLPVTLSAASRQTVSVAYATADGTATAPSDYAAASGTLTFAPGQTTKAVTVAVVGDTLIEPDETLTVTLSNPVNAKISRGSATGTIRNDDTQVPVTAGEWRGATPTGDYLYFEVTADRGMSYFRMNDIKEPCSPGGYFEGSLAFPPTTRWPIADNGTSGASGQWSGNDVEGDFTFTSETWTVGATFNGSSATGTFRLQDQFTYKGTPYSCDTGTVAWTASKVG